MKNDDEIIDSKLQYLSIGRAHYYLCIWSEIIEDEKHYQRIFLSSVQK